MYIAPLIVISVTETVSSSNETMYIVLLTFQDVILVQAASNEKFQIARSTETSSEHDACHVTFTDGNCLVCLRSHDTYATTATCIEVCFDISTSFLTLCRRFSATHGASYQTVIGAQRSLSKTTLQLFAFISEVKQVNRV